MSGDAIFRGLIDRGYTPVHAAAIAGHAVQESGGNPNALNPKEGAHGILQWRLDRWDNLQRFAKDRGASPNDLNTQLDFIAREMGGPEARAGSRFASTTDLPSASAALKSYIRFGDKSDTTRLNNAARFLGQAPAAGTVTAAAPANSSAVPLSLAPAPAADDGFAALLSAAQQIAAGAQENELPAALPPMRLGEMRLLPKA